MSLTHILLGTLVLVAFAADETPLAQQTTEYFTNFHNPVSFYADDATLRCESTLPFGGVYEGTDGINEFFAKLSATIKFAGMQFETMYMDARNGRVKAETKFSDGIFRGPLVDDTTRRFTRDKTVDLLHHLEFNVATGKLQDHTIMLKDPEEVQRIGDPKALKNFRALIQAYVEGPGTFTEESPIMDLVDDNVKVNLNLHPKALLDGKREWRGKEEMLEYANAMQGEDREPESMGRRLLQTSDAMVDKNGNRNAKPKDLEVLYADGNKIEIKTAVETMVLGGRTLRDFDKYETFIFDDEGLLTQLDVFFSRAFDFTDFLGEKGGADDEKEKKKKEERSEKEEEKDVEEKEDGEKEDDDDSKEDDERKPVDDESEGENAENEEDDKSKEDDN